jgi:hypothetical protein
MYRKEGTLDSETIPTEHENSSKSRPYDLTVFSDGGLDALGIRRPDLHKEISAEHLARLADRTYDCG